MLTKDEALLAAEVAEKYPAGIPSGAWGHNGGFDEWRSTALVIDALLSNPALVEYG